MKRSLGKVCTLCRPGPPSPNIDGNVQPAGIHAIVPEHLTKRVSAFWLSCAPCQRSHSASRPPMISSRFMMFSRVQTASDTPFQTSSMPSAIHFSIMFPGNGNRCQSVRPAANDLRPVDSTLTSAWRGSSRFAPQVTSMERETESVSNQPHRVPTIQNQGSPETPHRLVSYLQIHSPATCCPVLWE